MNSIQLELTDDLYRTHLEHALRNADDQKQLMVRGCNESTLVRVKALLHLPPDQQCMLHLLWESLHDKGQRGKSYHRLHSAEVGSNADYYARIAGYVPNNPTQPALAVIPKDGDSLQQDLRMFTDRIIKRYRASDETARLLAAHLRACAEEYGVPHDPRYKRTQKLSCAVFNTKLMQELIKHGFNAQSMRFFLTAGKDPADGKLDRHKASQVVEPHQWSGKYGIDTVNHCLTALPPSASERLAREFWNTYKDGDSVSRVLYRVRQPDAVRDEARAQSGLQQHRATVEMILRTIKVRQGEKLTDEHLASFIQFLGDMGLPDTLDDVMPLWNGMKESRSKFRECLSVTELIKRKAVSEY